MSNWKNIYVYKTSGRHGWRFRIRPRFYLLLAAALALAFGLNCGLMQLRIHRAEIRIAALQQQRLAQESRLLALDEAIALAETDAYVESIARSELNLLYPGEIRYIAG